MLFWFPLLYNQRDRLSAVDLISGFAINGIYRGVNKDFI